jgi:transposase-like protein
VNQPKLFKYRHYQAETILLCVRWYLRYSLSYRDLEEMMAERGLVVDHTTIYRWVQHYVPILESLFNNIDRRVRDKVKDQYENSTLSKRPDEWSMESA